MESKSFVAPISKEVKKIMGLIGTAPFESNIKVKLMRLLSGESQVVELSNLEVIESDEERGGVAKRTDQELRDIVLFLRAIKLPYRITQNPSEEKNGIVGFSIIVGRDANALDDLIKNANTEIQEPKLSGI